MANASADSLGMELLMKERDTALGQHLYERALFYAQTVHAIQPGPSLLLLLSLSRFVYFSVYVLFSVWWRCDTEVIADEDALFEYAKCLWLTGQSHRCYLLLDSRHLPHASPRFLLLAARCMVRLRLRARFTLCAHGTGICVRVGCRVGDY